MLDFINNLIKPIRDFIYNLNKFNKIVLFSAIVILIIVLIIITISLNYALFNANYPPVISDCPDFWDVSLNNDNQIICNNVVRHNRGICKNDSYPASEFYNYASNYDDVICAKYRWAKKCNISWDGITNNNKACE